MSDTPKAVIPESLPPELIESAQARREETVGELEVGDNETNDTGADQQLDSGFGGRVVLQAARQKAKIPDNAVSIQDRSEAPEDAEIIEGERGGLYYVPGGGDGTESESRSLEDIQDDVRNQLEESDDPFQESENIVSEATGIESVHLPTADTREDLVQLTSALSFAGERGMVEPVDAIDTGPQGDAVAAFRANDNTLRFKETVGTEEMEGSAERGQTVGDDLEWLVLHELGHAHHFENYDSLDEIGQVLDTGMSVSSDGEWIGGDRVDMADEQVSSYGRTSHGEFVAEVFSGLALGQEFSDEVLEVYEELDGPANWEDYRQ